jgi:uncharacterized protein (DUF302 family)
MLLQVSTKKSVTEAVAAFEKAIVELGFGVVAKHNFQETLKSKGVEFNQECQVVEVCNPHQAKSVLEKNMSVATVLPCRVAIYSQDGATTVATMTPTALLNLFNEPSLQSVAQEVEDVIKQAMKAIKD